MATIPSHRQQSWQRLHTSRRDSAPQLGSVRHSSAQAVAPKPAPVVITAPKPIVLDTKKAVVPVVKKQPSTSIARRPLMASSSIHAPVTKVKKQPTRPKAPQPEVSKQKPQPRTGLSLHLARTAHRADVLSRVPLPALVKPRRRYKETIGQFFKGRVATGFAVAMVLVLTGYVSFDTWLTNRKIEANYAQASSASSSNEEDRSVGEGRDESEVPASALASYKTAADTPRALYIDSLNVAARLMPMGINGDGSMQAPINIFDAGWYTGSAKPGSAGAVVIDAHASGPTRQGLFAYLDRLKEGDTVKVETGDGTSYSYRVVATETVNIEDVDMRKLMLPYGNATHGANFITCNGEWVNEANTYDKRTLVYTELIQ